MIPAGLLPVGMRYMVAGGWAVCPQLATDMDVFVLVPAEFDLQVEREVLLDHLRIRGENFEEEDETRNFIGYDGMVGVAKVAKVYPDVGCGKALHLLIANALNRPDDVLESFDLSICMVGILDNGRVVTTDYTTSPREPIIVLKNTPTTAERKQKYENRFGLVPPPLEVTLGNI